MKTYGGYGATATTTNRGWGAGGWPGALFGQSTTYIQITGNYSGKGKVFGSGYRRYAPDKHRI